MIGDRLDSDIEGANAVGNREPVGRDRRQRPYDLARAPKNQRPTYVAAGLGALAEKQPGVTVDGAKALL
jgi:ribonucleotide monophosphatase NagD (HAD superfamily)